MKLYILNSSTHQNLLVDENDLAQILFNMTEEEFLSYRLIDVNNEKPDVPSLVGRVPKENKKIKEQTKRTEINNRVISQNKLRRI